MIRVGLGYDLHRLAEKGKLILGGITIDEERGTVAHSDGDALVHAVIDSLLSPLNAGDIGQLFPDTDPQYKGISSLLLLREVADKYLTKVQVINIDAVVILDRPKLAPFISRMKQSLSDILGISPAQVGIKAKTSEQTRPDSVECYVVSLLDIPEK